ncbi:MAG TPA: hypothetical protein VI039_01510 [Solirubrobacterales bacterium]
MPKGMRDRGLQKLIRSVPRPSLAGKGLPERLRSTAFAFLGLTAAAGLALVAFFAQLGFPLLSPAPLPSPPDRNAVAEAVTLGSGPKAIAVAPGHDAAVTPAGKPDRSTSAESRDGKAGVGDSPEPVSGSGVSGDTGEAEPIGSSPQATPSPAPSPTDTSTAPADPAPASEVVAVSEPDAAPASVKPAKAEAKPGKSRPAKSKPPRPESKPAKSKPAKPEAKPDKSKPTPEPQAPKSEAKPPEVSYDPVPPPPPTTADKGKDKDKKGK